MSCVVSRTRGDVVAVTCPPLLASRDHDRCCRDPLRDPSRCPGRHTGTTPRATARGHRLVRWRSPRRGGRRRPGRRCREGPDRERGGARSTGTGGARSGRPDGARRRPRACRGHRHDGRPALAGAHDLGGTRDRDVADRSPRDGPGFDAAASVAGRRGLARAAADGASGCAARAGPYAHAADVIAALAAQLPSRTVDTGDPGVVHDVDTPITELPAYEGPPDPPAGHTHEWGADVASEAGLPGPDDPAGW